MEQGTWPWSHGKAACVVCICMTTPLMHLATSKKAGMASGRLFVGGLRGAVTYGMLPKVVPALSQLYTKYQNLEEAFRAPERSYSVYPCTVRLPHHW